MLTTGLRMTGGAFFFGAGFGSLLTDGFGVPDTVEEDLDEPDTEEEEPDELLLFCCFLDDEMSDLNKELGERQQENCVCAVKY